jgi:hypothetical protein
VHVTPTGLRTYARQIRTVAGQPAATPSARLLRMGELRGGAFGGPVVGDADAFDQGYAADRVLAQHLSDIAHFTDDVRRGLACIASAAECVAAIYERTDEQTADSVNAVDFAYGDPAPLVMPASPRPTGPVPGPGR